MSKPKLIPLSMWAERRYGDTAPSLRTLRRWIADSRIFPKPQKEGGEWRVLENAVYFDPANPDYSALAGLNEQAS